MADALASKFIENLADFIKDEVSMLLGVEDELKWLNNKIHVICTVLNDAEGKAFTKDAEGKAFNKDPIRVWLANLKDVIYDAEDVIDYCRTHHQRLARLSLEQSSLPILVRYYLPFTSCFPRIVFSHQIGSRIRSINNRLERVIKDKSELDLVASDLVSRDNTRIYRGTTPDLDPGIVGTNIHIDTEKLVNLILTGGSRPISIIAIVGMGGIGKATLAQNVINHHAITSNFKMPPPVWVSVTRDYSEFNLMKEVIRSIGGDLCDAQTREDLERKLTRLIEGKRFFLILDDVWKAQVWENLLWKPLSKGAHGSRVLITTRNEQVAQGVGAIHIHKVNPLSKEDSELENVWDIGMQIVEKCDGLPLAIRAIVGVLRMRGKSRREWLNVLENLRSLTNLPEGVMPVLYLSYNDLPFHLKQCFLYCSKFQEGFMIAKLALVDLWIAEGFVKKERNIIMEDKGEMYYNDLIARNLLQAVPEILRREEIASLQLIGASTDMYYKYSTRCTMHSLHMSLARSLKEDENFVGDVAGLANLTSSSSTKLRGLFVADSTLTSILNIITEQKSFEDLGNSRFISCERLST